MKDPIAKPPKAREGNQLWRPPLEVRSALRRGEKSVRAEAQKLAEKFKAK